MNAQILFFLDNWKLILTVLGGLFAVAGSIQATRVLKVSVKDLKSDPMDHIKGFDIIHKDVEQLKLDFKELRDENNENQKALRDFGSKLDSLSTMVKLSMEFHGKNLSKIETQIASLQSKG